MVQALHVEGDQIRTADGAIFKAIGCSDFAQLRRWLMPGGPAALVEPIIDERTALAREAGWTGPLIARIFRCAAPPNAFAVAPWSYQMSAVRDLTQLYGEKGWYVDWTGGDYHICFPSPDGHMGEVNGPLGINQHNNEFCAALIDLPNVIWNTCNEPFKNGVDTSVVRPPPWAPAVQYSGEYWDHRETTHGLACVNLHTDRGTEQGIPKWVGKAHESAPYMWRFKKPIFYDEPMGADELTKPARSNNPHYFGILGSVLSMVSVVYFHSTPGLSSDGFGPVVIECWKAFCRGAQGARDL